MSKIGKASITIPKDTQVVVNDGVVTITGPKGSLTQPINEGIAVGVADEKISVTRDSDDKPIKALHGLTQSLLANAIEGVTKGFEKKLELVGVGYRAQASGTDLTLTVGYSHPVKIKAPQGITFAVADNTQITITGIDKHIVGQIASNVRAVRPPEPYKGKGIKYQGERIRRKAGKAAKTAGGAK